MFLSKKKKREETRPLHFVSYHIFIYSHGANETHISRENQMKLSIFTIHHLLVKYTNENLSLLYIHAIFLHFSSSNSMCTHIRTKKNTNKKLSWRLNLWVDEKKNGSCLGAKPIPLHQQLHIIYLFLFSLPGFNCLSLLFGLNLVDSKHHLKNCT